MKQEELNEILRQHKLWLDFKGTKGQKANLKRANLEGVSLEGADLRYSDFRSANLEGANLKGANLEWANLEGAYVNNKPTPFVLGNHLILELECPYEERKNLGLHWNYIKKWTKLNKLTKELFL